MSRKITYWITGFMAILMAIAAIAPAAPPHTKTDPAKADPVKADTHKKSGAQSTTAALVTQGHTVFLSSCAPCHGADANGDDGPSLHHKSLPDAFIAMAVKEGFKDEMPPFGHTLKPAEQTAVVAYVHSLQK